MKVLYNNKVLSAMEREEYRIKADDTIQCLSESIDGFYEILQELKPSQNKEYDKIMSTVLDIELFTYYAHCDCVVMLKYFILSTSPYEKSLRQNSGVVTSMPTEAVTFSMVSLPKRESRSQ